MISNAVAHELKMPVGGNEAHYSVLLETAVPYARVERAVIDHLPATRKFAPPEGISNTSIEIKDKGEKLRERSGRHGDEFDASSFCRPIYP